MPSSSASASASSSSSSSSTRTREKNKKFKQIAVLGKLQAAQASAPANGDGTAHDDAVLIGQTHKLLFTFLEEYLRSALQDGLWDERALAKLEDRARQRSTRRGVSLVRRAKRKLCDCSFVDDAPARWPGGLSGLSGSEPPAKRLCREKATLEDKGQRLAAIAELVAQDISGTRVAEITATSSAESVLARLNAARKSSPSSSSSSSSSSSPSPS